MGLEASALVIGSNWRSEFRLKAAIGLVIMTLQFRNRLEHRKRLLLVPCLHWPNDGYLVLRLSIPFVLQVQFNNFLYHTLQSFICQVLQERITRLGWLPCLNF